MIGNQLEGKKVLFISVKFFNYENIIKETLIKKGAHVDLFDERPSNSFFTKAILRVYKNFYAYKINSYFRELIEQIKETRYDYFLLIKGEATPIFFIDFLRKNNPNIKLIYYTYDSFKNNSNGLKILDKFDYKYTFDSDDALKVGLEFRPLFFANDYAEVRKSSNNFQYDLSFIGTAHSDRYTISQYLYSWCKKSDLKMFTFYYSPSKLLFKFNKFFKKDFKTFDVNKISFSSLKHSDIIEIYKESRGVLDINHPGQKGLTMRTFETLGAGRKLITTNAEVKKYPFYNENNILVINRGDIKVDKSFFKTMYEPLSEKLLYAMSVEGWVDEVFCVEPMNTWNSVLKG
ncbi:hypothetical protein [Myroides marinus]|uniref:hypothetical protein n=1 Tax=Myroides marinus TaxID=703342 RepID=UPI0025772C47|nr:hypothetical protein [Myroides marinus]MDM1373359.1 lipopolysaccharide biosynthesis protein [Myroides marinus]